jgi:hypothetical protein
MLSNPVIEDVVGVRAELSGAGSPAAGLNETEPQV